MEDLEKLAGAGAPVGVIGGTDQVVAAISDDLLAFFADRLKVQLREQGARHDLVDAVFALEGQDDLLLIVRRVEALGKFLDTEDGKNLLAGYKRATNILRIEEKRDKTEYTDAPSDELFRQAEEWELARAIDTAADEATAAVAREDFSAAMTAMAKLRPHVDAFFEKVTVNVDEAAGARQPAEAPQPDSRRHPHGRGFLQDRGVGAYPSPSSGRVAERSEVGWGRFRKHRAGGLAPPPPTPQTGTGKTLRAPDDGVWCYGAQLPPRGTLIPLSRFPQSDSEAAYMFSTAHIQPVVALLAGILILLMPRLLNYIVAIYLIVTGIMGLGLRFH